MSKTIKYIFLGFIFLSVSFSFYFYQIFFTPNVNYELTYTEFYIKSTDEFDDVRDNLHELNIIDKVIPFSFVAKILKYQDSVKPGRYIITKGMTNLDLVRMLRNGSQNPINVTFHDKRLKNELATQLCSNLESTPEELLKLMNDNAFLDKYGFDSLTVPGMFIPNTYQFYWNTPATALFDRMYKEYQKFWNDDRKAKAKDLGLTAVQVSILASIVEEEQKTLTTERPAIAGVYLNRLERGQALQADPTIKFALGDFTLKRVVDLSVESPYNTYKYAGLPPGPICIPSINAIDAVLNTEKHDYYFFCARPDGSGYHDFSKTFAGHKLKAIKYRRQQTRNGNL